MNCSESMKPKHKRRVKLLPILKYSALTVLGVILFKIGAAQALVDRGYSAIGGEVFFLFLPVFYYLISKTVRDCLDDLRKKKSKRRKSTNE